MPRTSAPGKRLITSSGGIWPVSNRKAALKKLLGRRRNSGPVHYSDHVEGQGEAFYAYDLETSLGGDEAMIIGYSRTSTLEQIAGFEAQVAELMAAGCARIYKEHIRGGIPIHSRDLSPVLRPALCRMKAA